MESQAPYATFEIVTYVFPTKIDWWSNLQVEMSEKRNAIKLFKSKFECRMYFPPNSMEK